MRTKGNEIKIPEKCFWGFLPFSRVNDAFLFILSFKALNLKPGLDLLSAAVLLL